MHRKQYGDAQPRKIGRAPCEMPLEWPLGERARSAKPGSFCSYAFGSCGRLARFRNLLVKMDNFDSEDPEQEGWDRRYSDDLLLRVARRLAPNEDPGHTLKEIRRAASDRRGAVQYSRRRQGHNEYQMENEEEEEEEENERSRGHGEWVGEWEGEEEGHGWRVERGHDAQMDDRTLTRGMLSHDSWRAGGGDASDSSSGDEGYHVGPPAKYASLSRARLEVALHKSEKANGRLERIVQDILKAREAEARTAERAARREQLAMSELESRVVNGEAELQGRVRQLQEANKELKRRCDAEGQRGDDADEEMEAMAHEMAGAEEVIGHNLRVIWRLSRRCMRLIQRCPTSSSLWSGSRGLGMHGAFRAWKRGVEYSNGRGHRSTGGMLREGEGIGKAERWRGNAAGWKSHAKGGGMRASSTGVVRGSSKHGGGVGSGWEVRPSPDSTPRTVQDRQMMQQRAVADRVVELAAIGGRHVAEQQQARIRRGTDWDGGYRHGGRQQRRPRSAPRPGRHRPPYDDDYADFRSGDDDANHRRGPCVFSAGDADFGLARSASPSSRGPSRSPSPIRPFRALSPQLPTPPASLRMQLRRSSPLPILSPSSPSPLPPPPAHDRGRLHTPVIPTTPAQQHSPKAARATPPPPKSYAHNLRDNMSVSPTPPPAAPPPPSPPLPPPSKSHPPPPPPTGAPELTIDALARSAVRGTHSMLGKGGGGGGGGAGKENEGTGHYSTMSSAPRRSTPSPKGLSVSDLHNSAAAWALSTAWGGGGAEPAPAGANGADGGNIYMYMNKKSNGDGNKGGRRKRPPPGPPTEVLPAYLDAEPVSSSAAAVPPQEMLPAYLRQEANSNAAPGASPPTRANITPQGQVPGYLAGGQQPQGSGSPGWEEKSQARWAREQLGIPPSPRALGR